MTLFNRSLYRLRQARHLPHFAKVNFLHAEIAERLADRLLDMDRHFALAADLHAPTSQLRNTVLPSKISTWIELGKAVITDEEALPFADQTLDAIISNFNLHFVNDVVGTLIQANRALKPDGLFLAAMPGPRTLFELRQAMQRVAAQSGKAYARIAPFAEVRDAGALLQRAGFALPVVDSELIHLTYRDFSTLLREIQQMGQSNVLSEQFKGLTTANYWREVEAAYVKDEDGLYAVTVEAVFLTAWSPHESQQKPLPRGSGKVSLKQVF